jgi:hypothetical protein
MVIHIHVDGNSKKESYSWHKVNPVLFLRSMWDAVLYQLARYQVLLGNASLPSSAWERENVFWLIVKYE